MVHIGKTCRLQVLREVDFGLYLDGEDYGDILLPARYVPDNCQIDDWLDVFIYLDSEDTIIATTEKPSVEVGGCACLRVVDLNAYGAFMDWGLPKDLFVPFKEQRVPMQTGRSYAVYVFQDKSGRICGSSKLDHFLNEFADGQFRKNQAVDLLIVSQSPLGYKAVINGTHLGLLYSNELLTSVVIGQRLPGYIQHIRPDDTIDLTLQQQGPELRDQLSRKILDDLVARGGVSDLTDRSAAEYIFKRFGVSKGNYKKALGQLYKDKKILLGKDSITLIVGNPVSADKA